MDYPILLLAMENYNITTNTKLRFIVNIFPLPSHQNAFLFTKVIKAIENAIVQDQDIWNYLDLAFANQNDYYAATIENYRISEIVQNFTSLVVNNANFMAYNASYLNNALSD